MSDTSTPPQPESSSRWATLLWIVCTVVLVALVVGMWMRMRSESHGTSLANAIVAGKRPVAPAIPHTELTRDGTPGLPSWYRAPRGERATAFGPGAKVIVVNWWASWCGPCEAEADDVQKIARQYDGRVLVVGLDAGNEDLESDARDFVRRHRLRYPVVRGTRATKDQWGVGGFPETFVIGTDGRLSAHVSGPIDVDDLRDILDHELEQQR